MDEDGNEILAPKLKIFSNCKKLIETLPLQVNDEKDPEKVALTDYDHWVDAVSYGLAAHHYESSKPLPKEETVIRKHKRKLEKKTKQFNKRIS